MTSQGDFEDLGSAPTAALEDDKENVLDLSFTWLSCVLPLLWLLVGCGLLIAALHQAWCGAFQIRQQRIAQAALMGLSLAFGVALPSLLLTQAIRTKIGVPTTTMEVLISLVQSWILMSCTLLLTLQVAHETVHTRQPALLVAAALTLPGGPAIYLATTHDISCVLRQTPLGLIVNCPEATDWFNLPLVTLLVVACSELMMTMCIICSQCRRSNKIQPLERSKEVNVQSSPCLSTQDRRTQRDRQYAMKPRTFTAWPTCEIDNTLKSNNKLSQVSSVLTSSAPTEKNCYSLMEPLPSSRFMLQRLSTCSQSMRFSNWNSSGSFTTMDGSFLNESAGKSMSGAAYYWHDEDPENSDNAIPESLCAISWVSKPDFQIAPVSPLKHTNITLQPGTPCAPMDNQNVAWCDPGSDPQCMSSFHPNKSSSRTRRARLCQGQKRRSHQPLGMLALLLLPTQFPMLLLKLLAPYSGPPTAYGLMVMPLVHVTWFFFVSVIVAKRNSGWHFTILVDFIEQCLRPLSSLNTHRHVIDEETLHFGLYVRHWDNITNFVG